MTNKDGFIYCDFCGCHESRTTLLMAGENDSHICDCCAWDCATFIYEEIKKRFLEEKPKGTIQKTAQSDVYTSANTSDNTNKNEENGA